jgi:hypothetical protein
MKLNKTHKRKSFKRMVKVAVEQILVRDHSGSNDYHKHMETVVKSLDKLNSKELDALLYLIV